MADHQEEAQAAFVRRHRSDDGSILLFCSGDFDISTVQTMRDAFLHVEVADAPQVGVDLIGATFLDSSAIGLLVAACKRTRARGAAFSVSCNPGPVRLVLEISGLIEYLQVEVVG